MFINNDSISVADFLGKFKIYGHRKDSGHIGIQTKYNGTPINYDFGRYYQEYKGAFYDGPNVLRRKEKETPDSMSMKGAQAYEFQVTNELDNIISKKFRSKWDSGDKDIPEEIKKKMVLWDKVPHFKLLKEDHYMRSNWGIFGPNCLTFTFGTLNETLDEILNSEEVNDTLKCEAKEVKDKVRKIKGLSMTPDGVLDKFDGKSWTSSYYKAQKTKK